jgi:KH domain
MFAAQDVLMKQLIPANLAGVILGKGGETITSLQAATGTVMKMSKGNDFYPGIYCLMHPIYAAGQKFSWFLSCQLL